MLGFFIKLIEISRLEAIFARVRLVFWLRSMFFKLFF